MGDVNGFETRIVSGDIWPVGFDDDLSTPNQLRNHKQNANNMVGFGNAGSLSSNHTGTTVPAGNIELPYGDMQNMLLQRFDFNDGDISQITDLTNSLPKGGNDSAHECYDLTSNLDSTHCNTSKAVETSLFTSIIPTGSSKLSLHPVDVYGRVTLYEGKLVIQLRHFNINTNYPVSVGECWLCREKMTNGSQIHSHKHVLQGLFQVNDEFVQMDIDHFIIPEQALEPEHSDSQHNSMNSRNKVDMHRDVTLHEAINHTISSSHVESISVSASETLQMVNQIDLALAGNQDPKDFTSAEYSETNFIELPNSVNSLENTFGTQENSLVNFSGESKSVPPSALQSYSTGCSNMSSIISTSFDVSSSVEKSSVSPISHSCAGQSNLVNGNSEFPQNSLYESSVGQRETLGNCPNYFDSNIHYYSYEQQYNSQNEEKLATNLSMLSASSTYQTLNPPDIKKKIENIKTTEVGAKRRKSKCQRKSIVLKMTDDDKPQESDRTSIPLPSVNILGNGNEESLEDWFQNTLSSESSRSKKHDFMSEDVNLSSVDLLNSSGKKYLSKKSNLSSAVIEDSIIASESDDVPKEILSLGNTNDNKTLTNKGNAINKLKVECQICNMEFKNNLSVFKLHLQDHKLPPLFAFICSICPKSINNIDEFIQHLNTHFKNRIPCNQCSSTFSKIDKLQRHIETIHNTDTKRQYKCHICTKSFRRSDSLKSHLYIHSEKRFQCDICKKYYSSQYNLNVHSKNHSNSKPFSCELCDKSFPRKSFLASHVSTTHEKKKFECDVCLKLFSRPDVLMRHKIIHNDVKITHDCELCGKKFMRKDILKAHILQHQSRPENKTKCTQCPLMLSRKTTLRKHLIIHKNKEQCNICYKFLPTSAKLQKHLRWHENIISDKIQQQCLNNHECEFCHKPFKTKEILQRHILRTHCKKDRQETNVKFERVKKFFCNHCPKGFARSCNLRHHLKMHINNKLSDDDEILADLPIVLNAAKSSNSKNKTSINSVNDSGYILTKEEASSSNSPQFINLSNGTSSISKLLLEQRFVPVSASSQFTSHNSPFQPNSEIPISSNNFSNSSPNSPINLSTEAITAAAYLLAHPFYEGPYQ